MVWYKPWTWFKKAEDAGTVQQEREVVYRSSVTESRSPNYCSGTPADGIGWHGNRGSPGDSSDGYWNRPGPNDYS